MRILFVTGAPHKSTLGGAQPSMELAREFERLGWQTELVSLSERVPGNSARMRRPRAEHLRKLLVAQGSKYDVVDFDHGYLPYPRQDFPRRTLLVARSVLLGQQVAARSFPQLQNARSRLGAATRGRKRDAELKEMLRFASRSIGEADVVNVCNYDDADLLVRAGTPSEKILVLPFGLSNKRLANLAAMRPDRPHSGVVAFVGTFDWRKGAADMPAIIGKVLQCAPETRFRLLGTKGMFPNAEDVLHRFPARLRKQIDVIPSFAVRDLPHLLEDCALGFFPSYLEGFPFAVLEMLAASLPVVAYDAPGAPMMLDGSFLVPPGKAEALGDRIVALLHDPPQLLRARIDAAHRAAHFRWDIIAERTATLYEERLARSRFVGPDTFGSNPEFG